MTPAREAFEKIAEACRMDCAHDGKNYVDPKTHASFSWYKLGWHTHAASVIPATAGDAGALAADLSASSLNSGAVVSDAAPIFSEPST
jgi:hypothetical protein